MARKLNIPSRPVSQLARGVKLPPKIGTAFQHGLALHQQGQLIQAQQQYGLVLKTYPNHIEALRLSGMLEIQTGRYQEAVDLFDRAIAIDQSNANIYSNRGVALKNLKFFEAALDSYDQAIRVNPNYSEAHNNRGNLLHKMKRLAEALFSFDEAIRLKADYAEPHYNRGNVLYELGKSDAALKSYVQATLINPSYVDAYNAWGNLHQRMKRFEEALECYGHAIRIQPNHLDALNNRGVALKELGRFDEALASYDDVIRVSPFYAEAYSNRGITYQRLGRLAEAMADYDQAIQINPGFAQAYSNRGDALQELKRLDEALVNYEHAIRINPSFAEAYNNHGNTLRTLKRFDEALASYGHAVSIKADYPDAHSNKAVLLKELKRLVEARDSFDQALLIDPDFVAANWNQSLFLILTGDYLRGWEQYEWRFKNEELKESYYKFPQLAWRGQEDISGKKLLIHGEQGFGDVIQFCRYLPYVKALGAHIIFEVTKPLVSFVSSLKCEMIVIARGEPLPVFDAYCPVMSLPFVFKTTVETIPSQIPYLYSDQIKVANWQRRLGLKDRVRIGVVWSGSKSHANDMNRSLPLDKLLPLFSLPVEWHSLQKEYQQSDLEALNQNPQILQHQNDLNDFADTAALIQCMDLVISVDTSVVHVAGAIGKPVWILLPYNPDYRWLLEREDSPWYPSARLFRQESFYDWTEVIQSVKDDLQSWLRKAG